MILRLSAVVELEPPGQYGKPRIFNDTETVNFACLPTIPLLVGALFAESPDTTL
ncbi:MAG: hypothetical protein ACYDBJ_27625 [Aggregatilineales bacterium]